MTSLKKYIDFISPISEESWKMVAPLFVEKQYAKGEFFIEEGKMETQIGFLQSGIMRAYYQSDNGTQYNNHFFVPPCFVGGYASLVMHTPNQINQEALTDCVVQVARFSEFEKLYARHQDIERVARKLAELFFVQKEQKEIEIVLLDADERYQLFLEDHPKLDQEIPQNQIASYLGITPAQLSRIRKKFTSR